MNFVDKTQIFISHVNKYIVFVNKKHEISRFPLKEALRSNNHEMVKNTFSRTLIKKNILLKKKF